MRIPHICNFNAETTVLAHLNGGGLALKHHDLHAAYLCSDCHDAYDRRRSSGYCKDDLELMFLKAMVRTQQILLRDGLIEVK